MNYKSEKYIVVNLVSKKERNLDPTKIKGFVRLSTMDVFLIRPYKIRPFIEQKKRAAIQTRRWYVKASDSNVEHAEFTG